MTPDNEKIIVLGGGGHAKVLIEVIRLCKKYEIAGIVDRQLKPGVKVSGIPVIGDDSQLPGIFSAEGIGNACIGVGSIKDNSKRKALYEIVKQIGFSVPALIHPGAIVSAGSRVSEGAQLMANAVIQTDSFIGENTIINTGAIIEHDCSIGKHVHVCPAAVVTGGCNIGEGSFIGAGATVINGINIGKNVTIAAGSLVIHDVEDGATVKGVPAK
jgi:UDP-perosamine 4-acetyltransferase